MTVVNCENTCTLDQPAQTSQDTKTPLFTRLWATLKRVSTAMCNRSSLEKLNSMSDHDLADMGLRREDLYIVNHARMFTDPSAELQRRASKNHCGVKNS